MSFRCDEDWEDAVPTAVFGANFGIRFITVTSLFESVYSIQAPVPRKPIPLAKVADQLQYEQR